MASDDDRLHAITSAIADGLRGVLEVGLANIPDEEREQWSNDIEPNLLKEPPK